MNSSAVIKQNAGEMGRSDCRGMQIAGSMPEWGDDFREIGIELAWVERIVRDVLEKAPKNG